MRRHNLAHNLVLSLKNFNRSEYSLNGLSSDEHYMTLAMQLVDSIRRIEFVKVISNSSKPVSPYRTEPNSDLFDPIRAARLHYESGNYDEACWLIFLATHFGKNIKTKWKLCSDIYSGLGTDIWTWDKITENFGAFEMWYENNSLELIRGSTQRQYGNHRKYETLKYNSRRSIPKVFQSYINFIGQTRSHEARFEEAKMIAQTPELLFEVLYSNMRSVISFGRTAKFDYLTMLKKTNLLDVEPNHLFLRNSTGPIKGCRLLFSNNIGSGDSIEVLNKKLSSLATILPINYLRMQVLEDALCNWQKSPDSYRYFGG
ncbi:hypothetical protein AB6F64_18185 [Providencia hangzhouensis]|uniref:Alpha-glutamyl/putrescinyl thymine pyrophosphorylase clade 3 domain-containing protein n=1 Tax=Providencia rettgeri TaxID=587 RepID=A0AAJ4NHW5_PRORE|nr:MULTISPECIES: hypothetical protein [Providencia]HEM8344855.1 hypothetical protein [Providencia stuartii]EHZ6873068.1 hypothetical protein [Providencia rettgeri]ELR5065105.1 hypothetical protein [Providencia rettgeri]ELR5164017.1 hypothetical protein [Providencia rettgeri]MBJ9970029.1 hypothetical protein [Providencia rettgeri]